MDILPAPVSALSGLTDARSRADTAAHNIANASTDPFSPLRFDGTQGEPEGSTSPATS
jgi:flagellar basal body rod protein FlgG